MLMARARERERERARASAEGYLDRANDKGLLLVGREALQIRGGELMDDVDMTFSKYVLGLDHAVVEDLGPVHVELVGHQHEGRHDRAKIANAALLGELRGAATAPRAREWSRRQGRRRRAQGGTTARASRATGVGRRVTAAARRAARAAARRGTGGRAARTTERIGFGLEEVTHLLECRDTQIESQLKDLGELERQAGL